MDYAAEQRNPGKHVVGIIVVVLFHVIIGYALVNGLARKVVDVVRGPIETKIIKEVKPPPPEAPPPPPPKLQPPPPPFIPAPEVNIAQPAAVTNTISVTRTAPVAAPPAAKPAARVAPVVKASSCREPEYPPSSARLGEAGRVVLLMLVGVDGHITDSKIQTSSGFPKLDEAARRALSLCRFKPGTADGQPEPAWAPIAYVFKNPNQ